MQAQSRRGGAWPAVQQPECHGLPVGETIDDTATWAARRIASPARRDPRKPLRSGHLCPGLGPPGASRRRPGVTRGTPAGPDICVVGCAGQEARLLIVEVVRASHRVRAVTVGRLSRAAEACRATSAGENLADLVEHPLEACV